MSEFQPLSTQPPLHTPILISVRETLKRGKDAMGQIYEGVIIEYVTAAFEVGDGSMDVIIPVHPENNIDSLWESGTTYVMASTEGPYYLVGTGAEGSRYLEIRGWKEID